MSTAGNEQLQSFQIGLDVICNALVVELKEVVRNSVNQECIAEACVPLASTVTTSCQYGGSLTQRPPAPQTETL